jgi:hypothetical protein
MVNATTEQIVRKGKTASKMLGGLFSAFALFQPAFAFSQNSSSPPTSETFNRAQISENYDSSSIAFEANPNASESSVKFVSRGNGYGLYLTATEAVLAFRNSQLGASCKVSPTVASRDRLKKNGIVAIEWLGANPDAAFEATQPLAARVNHFTGTDPTQWRSDVALFSKVRQKSVYPGIDLVYYGNQRQIEYDFRRRAGRRSEINSHALSWRGRNHNWQPR